MDPEKLRKVQELVQYLQGLRDYRTDDPSFHSVRPVLISFAHHEFCAAFYRQNVIWKVNERERPYVRDWLFVLGEWPPCISTSGNLHRPFRDGSPRICFPYDGREWYLATYSSGEHCFVAIPQLNFGPYFILTAWEVPSGEAIDEHEEKKYTRVAMNLINL